VAPRLMSALDSIIVQQSTLMSQNDALAQQNATLISQNADLSARVAALERLADNGMAASAQTWICPVCHSPFKHRESFKGHIRRLAQPVSASAHCFLDESNPDHVSLVSHERYGDGDFASRAVQFTSQLYDTIKSNSSSRRSSESSHRAVRFGMNIAGGILLFSFVLQIHEWLADGNRTADPHGAVPHAFDDDWNH
jgi:hypothetical protein